jgi:hydroxyacylglutathione hydrolase
MTGKLKVKQTVVGPIGTNCYLVMNEETKELFAVDPGDEGERLISELREMGGVPKAILLTHGHTDHIMGVMALRAGYPDPADLCRRKGKTDAERSVRQQRLRKKAV